MELFEARTEVPVPAEEAFRWHARPGAFVRLSPPWNRVTVIGGHGGIDDGARLTLRVGSPPLSIEWVAVHRGYEEGRRFVDEQESGPFAAWVHEHLFEDGPQGRSVVVDRIEYTIPFGRVGDLAAGAFTRRRLERLFRFRGAIMAGDLARHAPYVDRPPLRVAITGASGLIGSQLAAFLTAGGHQVLRFARAKTARDGEIFWNPATGRIDHESLEGLDAIVHLAGENLGGGRWTEARKAEIRASRVKGTNLLAEAISVLREPPKAFLCASAVGYYGDRGDERLDETASPGTGFLADVARAWEDGTEPAQAAGIRTVRMRFGVILTSRGGAFARMRLPFELGLGGPIGGGRQGFSWIALDDAIYAIHHLIRHDEIRGPVNVVAPGPVTQRVFATEIGRSLRRPAVLPLPASVVTRVFGEMGEEMLLRGQFVEPAVLKRSGFTWSVARLEDALAR
jgi:uncharacterized protein (TIGR01777 family)